jgi:hypothetical protein
VITVGEGLVKKLDVGRGLGEIVPKGDGTPLVFLLTDTAGLPLRPGEPVSFEYGVAGSETGQYMKAALKVRPLYS